MAESFYDEYAIEKQCKTTWDRDMLTRAEFRGNYDSYVAFKKAEARGLTREWSPPGDRK